MQQTRPVTSAQGSQTMWQKRIGLQAGTGICRRVALDQANRVEYPIRSLISQKTFKPGTITGIDARLDVCPGKKCWRVILSSPVERQ